MTTLARKTITPNRVDRLAALEDGLQIVAVREISDVVDVANATSLRDNDAVKELSDLKKNAAQTMLLLERVGRYVATRRGDITFGHPMFDNKLPEEVERAAERKVVDAIARFRLNK